MNTIIGVGNILLTDDGIGVHCVRNLQSILGGCSHLSFIDAGTLSYELLDWISDSETTLIIDAAYMNSAPGTVKVFCGDEIDAQFESAPSRTVHQISLRDTLKTSRVMFGKPRQYALIGIEPSSLEWGDSPSQLLLDSLPKVTELTCQILNKWGIPIERFNNLSELSGAQK